ncbi:hypothetical protein OTU49_009858 [Cherax quadricarinatus]|uniref:EB domain-containing protein n=1 Tax=Cherax quadricarinatus TaxID=27406 RepID=A0AAW0W9C3_CHEQU|nr:uncharacterized protein LOC128701976 isoform X2 [Cherax quadricarinatus]
MYVVTPCISGHILLLLLVLVAGMMTKEAAGYHSGHMRGHHSGHHEQRAARNRREQGEPTPVVASGDGLPGSETQEGFVVPCTKAGTDECSSLINSECNVEQQLCVCPVPFPILDVDHSYCVKEAKLNTTCQFTSQCEEADEYSLCSPTFICVCQDGYRMEEYPNIGFNCVSKTGTQATKIDPAMIGVLAGLALMFIIICVVLRLFSKARFRETRSIFNTPNPRLMNASLFKDSKLLSPARGDRRGSRASVRVPSRAPSVTSVNAASRSPNGSLAKVDVTGGRRGSAMSAVSGTGSAAAVPGAQTAPKTPSPIKDPKTKTETTVAIETVD